MNTFISASLLFSVYILQRIDVLGTSAAMLMLGIVFLFMAAQNVIRGRVVLSSNIALWLYPLYLLAFTYQFPVQVFREASLEAYIVFIAPVLVWAILIMQPEYSVSELLNRKVLVAVTAAVGYFLVRDFFNILSDGTGNLKKTYAFANPNYTGFMLNTLLIFFLMTEKRDHISFAGSVYLLFNTMLIALTLSKTGYAIQVFVALLYFRRKIVYAMAAVIPVAMYLGIKYVGFFELFSNFFKRSSDTAVSHRIGLMICALNAFFDNPLFGVGYGNFRWIGAKIYHTPLDVKVHNLFLSSLAENGIVGFSILLASVALLLQRLSVWKTSGGMMMALSLFVYASTHTGTESLSLLPVIIFVLSAPLNSTSQVNTRDD